MWKLSYAASLGTQERGPLLELATHKNGSRVVTRDIGVKWPLTGTYITTNKHWKCKKKLFAAVLVGVWLY